MENTLPEIRVLISNVLLQVGIPRHVAGFKFLARAVEIVINNNGALTKLSQNLYPLIATEFLTRSANVDRSIRHAISIAFNRGKIVALNGIFGVNVYGPTDKPSNGEFIALLAARIPFLLEKKNK